MLKSLATQIHKYCTPYVCSMKHQNLLQFFIQSILGILSFHLLVTSIPAICREISFIWHEINQCSKAVIVYGKDTFKGSEINNKKLNLKCNVWPYISHSCRIFLLMHWFYITLHFMNLHLIGILKNCWKAWNITKQYIFQ